MNDKYKKMASTPFGIDAFVICFIYAHKLPLFFSFVKPFLYLLQLENVNIKCDTFLTFFN